MSMGFGSGPDADRTRYPLHAMEVLYQLSYRPVDVYVAGHGLFVACPRGNILDGGILALQTLAGDCLDTLVEKIEGCELG
jgi:hypothetical protein